MYRVLHFVWIKLLLYITRRHVGSEGVVTFILNLCAGWGKWLALHLGRFTPTKIGGGTHWTGGRVSLRASLDSLEKIQIFYTHRASPHDSSVV